MQAGKLNLLGLGCSDPVRYFKTAGVNSILFQQHFQVHQDGKDKPNKKIKTYSSVNDNTRAAKALSVLSYQCFYVYFC